MAVSYTHLEISLEDALDLSQQIENFSVIREATTPADYAKFMLSKYCIECEGELFSCANLHKYGEKLMEEKGILLTGYGVLWLSLIHIFAAKWTNSSSRLISP